MLGLVDEGGGRWVNENEDDDGGGLLVVVAIHQRKQMGER